MLSHSLLTILVASRCPITNKTHQLTNNLQRKLDDVRQEKAKLEEQIHREHQANTKLRSQLSDLRNSQMETSQNLEVQDEMEEE